MATETLYSLPFTLQWHVDGFAYVDSQKVTKKCEAFLQEKCSWSNPKSIPIPVDFRYPWGIASEELSDYRKGLGDELKIIGFENVMTIVCLNPVIVVSVRGVIEYREFLFWFSPPGAKPAIIPEKQYVILDRGFAYGTRMPYDPKPQWYSPDLNITPRDVEMLSPDKGRIPVSWGYLILNHEKDEWVVTSEAKE